MSVKPQSSPSSEQELVALCAQLGAHRVGPLSTGERRLIQNAKPVAAQLVESTRAAILRGDDPLSAVFCQLRSPATRRERGATYTPLPIVRSMLGWAATAIQPARVIDPGAGSARFLLESARAFAEARLIGVELDPVAALMARANLAIRGLADRAEVHVTDYRAFAPEPAVGPTLFVGNPPYVRHHDIDQTWKTWLTETAARHGFLASQLAGLHVHFFLATLQHASPGDMGAFITASEWLDVNYGKLVRQLLAGPLGMQRMDVLDPKLEPFADAQTTAVITCFQLGCISKSVYVRRVDAIDSLASLSSGGEDIPRAQLHASPRWSNLQRNRGRDTDLVELGELCRVHRGQVTGANAVWIASSDTPALPSTVLRPTITKARELFASDGILRAADQLRLVIDLPRELDGLSASERYLIEVFLAWAREAGAHESYIARHRKPWWAVRLRQPAPILATYMARRPPAFVRNLAGARHINIAHGLYPRDPLADDSLDALAGYLATSVSTSEGRTYAGGLTKFEPKEMERLLVPTPTVLQQLAADKRAA